MAQHFQLELRASRMLAPTVRHLVFARADGEALPYIPGQFLQIHFPIDGKPGKRSYSIANAPGTELYEIAVSYVDGGAATALLSALPEGGRIDASGPYGRFCLMPNDDNQRYLLIGTGTGVTPYRAMLPMLAAAHAERGVQVALLFGARNGSELLYCDEFEAFARLNPWFRFHPCLSRVDRDGSWPDDRRGYVQNLLAELNPSPGGDIAYLCGNPNMVDACFEQLKTAELPIPRIRREKYVSSR
jgi:ferredoxin-NADP reductase